MTTEEMYERAFRFIRRLDEVSAGYDIPPEAMAEINDVFTSEIISMIARRKSPGDGA